MARTPPGRDEERAGGRRFWRVAEEVAEGPLSRVASVAVPAVLDALDVEQLLERIDIDDLLDRVDIDRLLDRVDVNRLLDRVDVERLLDRVDIQAVTRRAGIGDIVTESTGQVTASALDLARRQMVGLDTVLLQIINRVLGRDPRTLPTGPPELTPGRVAGS